MTAPDTDADRAARIAAIRQRWERATMYTAPWAGHDDRAHPPIVNHDPVPASVIILDAIAHAPDDIGWLLGEVERLGDGVAALRDAVASAERVSDWPISDVYAEVWDELAALVGGEMPPYHPRME